MNTFIFVDSLSYVRRYDIICCLAQWIYVELKNINYTDAKLSNAIAEDDIEIVKDIINLVKQNKLLCYNKFPCKRDLSLDMRLILLNNNIRITKGEINDILNESVEAQHIELFKYIIETIDDNVSLFKYAVCSSNYKMVRMFFEIFDPNYLIARDKKHDLIDIVCIRGDIKIMELFIEYGLEIEHKYLTTVIIHQKPDLIELLTNYGLEPTKKELDRSAKSCYTCESFIDKYDSIKYLEIAAVHGNIFLVNILLEKGMKPTRNILEKCKSYKVWCMILANSPELARQEDFLVSYNLYEVYRFKQLVKYRKDLTYIEFKNAFQTSNYGLMFRILYESFLLVFI